MKTWNLNAAAARIELAMQDLTKAVGEAGDLWDDAAYQRFGETYLRPLEPKVRDTLEALRRLEQTLYAADRACGRGHE